MLLNYIAEFLQSEIERLELDENTVQNCLDERLSFIYKLFCRVAQIGPNVEQATVFDEIEHILAMDNENELECSIVAFYQFQRKLMDMFFGEKRDNSQDAYTSNYAMDLGFFDEDNINARKRLFLTINKIIGLDENKSQHGGIDPAIKYHTLIKPLFSSSIIPRSWPAESMLKTRNLDLLGFYHDKMGIDSKNSNEVIEFFVNDALSPELKYLNWGVYL